MHRRRNEGTGGQDAPMERKRLFPLVISMQKGLESQPCWEYILVYYLVVGVGVLMSHLARHQQDTWYIQCIMYSMRP